LWLFYFIVYWSIEIDSRVMDSCCLTSKFGCFREVDGVKNRCSLTRVLAEENMSDIAVITLFKNINNNNEF
jgi:hypothetical protein